MSSLVCFDDRYEAHSNSGSLAHGRGIQVIVVGKIPIGCRR